MAAAVARETETSPSPGAAASPSPEATTPPWRNALHALRKRLSALSRPLRRFVSLRLSSSLTRRIVVLNLGGLVALLAGFLYLNQFR